MLDPGEVDALIKLLDDSDTEVLDHVTDQLISLGAPIIPKLEDVWENTNNNLLQERIELLIARIQYNYTINEFEEWIKKDSENLLKGALIIAKFQYPELDLELIQKKVFNLQREIWVELNNYLSPFEQVNIFNQIFYKLHKFSGATSNLIDPQTFYLNNLIETKKGNPLSLGILYLSIASQLKMPVYGVNLPHHFCIAYMKHELDHDDFADEYIEREILFYINPLNSGLIFTKNEIEDYLNKLGMEKKPTYFTPVDNVEVLKLLINSLKDAYKLKDAHEKVDELDRFLIIIDNLRK